MSIKLTLKRYITMATNMQVSVSDIKG